jgi:polysaccharide export outer membrane protein
MLPSCYTTKKMAYFQDLPDTTKIITQALQMRTDALIQPDDILGIDVNSLNPEAAAPFNLGNTTTVRSPVALVNASPSTMGGGLNQYATRDDAGKGYVVDKDGFIYFAGIGQLKVSGMNTSMVRDTIRNILNTKYLKDAVVNVRLLNYKITVLGEVKNPATFTIPSERISIIDALGMAGDLTPYGERYNVLLIREESGERKFIRIDMKTADLFKSPYYYLKQNDVIYVKPSKWRTAATDTESNRWIALGTALISLISLVVVISRH